MLCHLDLVEATRSDKPEQEPVQVRPQKVRKISFDAKEDLTAERADKSGRSSGVFCIATSIQGEEFTGGARELVFVVVCLLAPLIEDAPQRTPLVASVGREPPLFLEEDADVTVASDLVPFACLKQQPSPSRHCPILQQRVRPVVTEDLLGGLSPNGEDRVNRCTAMRPQCQVVGLPTQSSSWPFLLSVQSWSSRRLADAIIILSTTSSVCSSSSRRCADAVIILLICAVCAVLVKLWPCRSLLLKQRRLTDVKHGAPAPYAFRRGPPCP